MLIQVRSLEDLKTFSGMVLQQRVVGSSTEHNASSRSHAIIRMEVAMMILMTIIIMMNREIVLNSWRNDYHLWLR